MKNASEEKLAAFGVVCGLMILLVELEAGVVKDDSGKTLAVVAARVVETLDELGIVVVVGFIFTSTFALANMVLSGRKTGRPLLEGPLLSGRISQTHVPLSSICTFVRVIPQS